ncbi:MAG: elongation factor G [Gemmataceae bacterium]
MSQFDITKIRNIGIIAHIDAGKTTTTEHILYYAGAKHKLGGVDEGTTDTDYDEEEQERGITIYSACIPFRWQDCTVNLIDTPGHVDFTAEVERSLRVLDGAVVVFDAQKGVEAQSETVWRQANKYKVPRLVFINKMDVVGANFKNAMGEVAERLEGRPVPVAIPIGSGSIKDSATPFAGTIDLLEMKALYFEKEDNGKTIRKEDIPEDLADEAASWRENLFDVLCENDEDDKITTAYLEGQDIPIAKIRELIREQTLKLQIQPVLCGSGREHMGVQPLIDAVCWYLPAPSDVPPVVGTNPKKKDKQESRKPSEKDPFSGLVFKIISSSHGDLYYVRIYSGVLKANSRVWNPGRKIKEFASKLYHVHADPKQRDDLPNTQAGDIVAIIGPKDSVTGDTLCDQQNPILLEQISFAQAVISRSIEPQSSADKDKLVMILDRMMKEDPTFHWLEDPETGQMLMTGMGLLHLEVKAHLLEREHKLKVRIGKPSVSYRERIDETKTVVGECIKQAGNSNLFARIKVKFEGTEGEHPVVVNHELDPEAVPPEFIEAAVQGVQGAMGSGDYGYPLIQSKATIVSAEVDPELSNEVAFSAAGADAVHKALKNNVVLLEPVMRLEVAVPEEHLGSVTGDLNARRAEIAEIVQRANAQHIDALIPMAKMFDYSDKVRSLTQGRASWSMEPDSYRPVPSDVLNEMFSTDSY